LLLLLLLLLRLLLLSSAKEDRRHRLDVAGARTDTGHHGLALPLSLFRLFLGLLSRFARWGGVGARVVMPALSS
jgi:hypothetical protein